MQKITLEEAVSRLREVAEPRLPEGAILDSRGGDAFSIRCELAWAVDAHLRVSPRIDGNTLKPHVSVTWSSSSLPPAGARAAAKLHVEMADLACLLEAVIAGLPEIEPFDAQE